MSKKKKCPRRWFATPISTFRTVDSIGEPLSKRKSGTTCYDARSCTRVCTHKGGPRTILLDRKFGGKSTTRDCSKRFPPYKQLSKTSVLPVRYSYTYERISLNTRKRSKQIRTFLRKRVFIFVTVYIYIGSWNHVFCLKDESRINYIRICI